MYDLHCHILPGVDDGARTMAESAQMLDAARSCGIDTIVCTPHCRGSYFDRAAIQAAYRELQPHAAARGIALRLGYEVHWQKLAELGLEQAGSLVFEGTNLLLLEFDPRSLPGNWRGVVQALAAQGLQVIVAHPERYAPVQKNPRLAAEMKELGCLLQLSGSFACGGRGSSKGCALELLRAGLVDYVASDAHCVADYTDYRTALKLARCAG